MKILLEGEIKKSIRRCKPSKVAVAYIGADWKTFIPDARRLGAMIVSPTFGSNPRAVVDVAKSIGWENIYFLEELHAKIYIGANSAVIGSANLTSNGLSGEKLVELCVEVSATEALKDLDGSFENLRKRAQQQYPTIESKKARTRELEACWGAAIANRIINKSENNEIPAFSKFELLGKDHFYVLWYQPVKVQYSDEVKSIESFIVDDIHFTNVDQVERNKWALVWRVTDSNKPHKAEKPYWLYIHEVFENGVIDEGYEYRKCAVQRKDLDVPPPPFDITTDVALAFKKAVQEKDIAEYLVQEKRDPFNLAYSLNGIPCLMKKMKEVMAKKSAGPHRPATADPLLELAAGPSARTICGRP